MTFTDKKKKGMGTRFGTALDGWDNFRYILSCFQYISYIFNISIEHFAYGENFSNVENII